MITDFISFVIALAILVMCGRLIVRTLTSLAQKLGVSEYILAFILLAVATSIPELFVGVSSARQGAGDLVLALALGSNIINMTLIVGAAAVVSMGISTTGLNLKRDVLLGGGITFMPLLLLLDGVISRWDGLFLLTLFLFYITLLYKDHGSRRAVEKGQRNTGSIMVGVLMVLGLVAVLVYASEVTVSSVVAMAEAMNVPSFIIGIFVLAFGTSLTELTTTLNAALLKRPGLAIGAILGGNVADSGLIVGVSSLARSLHINLDYSLLITGIYVVIVTGLMALFTITRGRISTREGFLLLALFVGFVFLLIFQTSVLVPLSPDTLMAMAVI